MLFRRLTCIAGPLSTVLVGIAGCSAEQNGPTPAANVASNAFASHYAQIYCESISGCCAQAGIAPDVASCRATLEPVLSAQVKIYLADSKIAYDESATGACLDALRASISSCTDRSQTALTAACSGVFRGTVPIGGGCSNRLECIKPDAGFVSCPGVCEVASSLTSSSFPHGALGDACVWTCGPGSGCVGTAAIDAGADTACWIEDNLYCADDRRCATTPTIGQACGGNSRSCAADAKCDTNKVCVAKQAIGPCAGDTDCLGPSFCDVMGTQQCTAPKADGEACAYDGQCINGYCSQSACRTWTVANAGSCAGLID
jgi:hypothetical protein